MSTGLRNEENIFLIFCVHYSKVFLPDFAALNPFFFLQRCAYCRRFGATVVCCIPECGKRFHFPCAAASGCFQVSIEELGDSLEYYYE